ncbi:histamine N-methyltransferase-like isoform X2 [Megalops cyprinoides]|uniref:histamine N-methyltransferase-like isoform X2 n=1 Tax=Megalops cyprinoides TaxID=118141 RepID=UPI001864D051|nr:histamine N-methyltransferase-like isoform X2 [Megalops cyprinoides]
MASTPALPTGYQGRYVQGFQMYLQRSQEHQVIQAFMDRVLPVEFARIGEGKKILDVLGVGSGGGEMDAYLLSILQSKLPGIPITADIVEPSTELTDSFKALVAKTPSLQKVPFTWHVKMCAEYESMVKEKKEAKRFDFMHMIQMLYYVSDYSAAIKFFHSLLRENGQLLIVHEAANSGWEKLWKTYRKELCTKTISSYLSAGDIKALLQGMGLRFEEHSIPNTLDISDCFLPGHEAGEKLLDFMTEQDHFHQSLTPEVRAGILKLLKHSCSVEREGRVLFDCSLSALLVHA